jgi:predicted O-methyltransferase YrrM
MTEESTRHLVGSDKNVTYHPETYVEADELGKVIPPYRPTFGFGDHVNEHHRFLAHAMNPQTGILLLTAPGLMDHAQGEPIIGWLRLEDAQKLYELGFYCSGDILELGSYEGLSTCILAQAIADSGNTGVVTTVDLTYRPGVKSNARACGLASRIEVITADACAAIQTLHPKRYEFIFVDHSHEYEHVKDVCLALPELVTPGAFVLFHDYNDERNGNEPNYGVYQAVIEHLPKQFRFCGVYGCTGLYRAD